MSWELLGGFFYLVVLASTFVLLKAKTDREILISASLLTLCLGGIMWAETRENLLFFSLFVFLLFDIGLVAFAPMLRRKQSTSPPTTEKNLQMSLSLWFLGALGATGLWAIWQTPWADILKPVSKVFSQSVCLEFWTSYWPLVMVVGLVTVSISLGALLMVKAEREELS